MRQIEITISPTGETQIEAKGYQGSACQYATAKYEQALGTYQQRTLKPEIWQEQRQQQEVKQ
jgi:Protein of unknown function (DUF2997)